MISDVFVNSEISQRTMRKDWLTIGVDDDVNDRDKNRISHENLVKEVSRILGNYLQRIFSARFDNSGAISISDTKAQKQLNEYVSFIASKYRDVGYHSVEHAAHVTVSMNKMISMIEESVLCNIDCTCSDKSDDKIMNCCPNNKKNDKHLRKLSWQGPGVTHTENLCDLQDVNLSACSPACTIAKCPLLQFATVFAAFIHDVDHVGVPNRQLIQEGNQLAILYNDQSVAEQHSIYVALSTLSEDRFSDFYKMVAPTSVDRILFRRLVIDMVLCTDIASPSRLQIGMSKWKSAFETPTEVVNPPSRRHTIDFSTDEGSLIDLGIKYALNLDDRLVKESPQGLKVASILEQIMQAVDVAHTMQSWDIFVKWNTRLFIELNDAYVSGRGNNPASNWFNGQIGFFDYYVIPLAKRLQQSGVFGIAGDSFVENAVNNKNRWQQDGLMIVNNILENVCKKER